MPRGSRRSENELCGGDGAVLDTLIAVCAVGLSGVARGQSRGRSRVRSRRPDDLVSEVERHLVGLAEHEDVPQPSGISEPGEVDGIEPGEHLAGQLTGHDLIRGAPPR